MTNGASRSRLREYNARTVIHALRRGGPASQSEIAERAGLSVPAVSAIMRSLTEEGYIREVRSDNHLVDGGRGSSSMWCRRRPTHSASISIRR